MQASFHVWIRALLLRQPRQFVAIVLHQDAANDAAKTDALGLPVSLNESNEGWRELGPNHPITHFSPNASRRHPCCGFHGCEITTFYNSCQQPFTTLYYFLVIVGGL